MNHLVDRTSLNVSKLLKEFKVRKILMYLWGPKLNICLLHKETYYLCIGFRSHFGQGLGQTLGI